MDLGDIIAAAAQRYGQDPAVMLREAQIESSMNPVAHNASGASGLFQFMPGTAASYGLSNPFDPAASADAAARLMRDNAAALTHALGRAPTPAELYLAHQQGSGGAASILLHPDAPANANAAANGGAGMTNGQFAQFWAGKFNGAKPSGGTQTVSGPGLMAGGPTLPHLDPSVAALFADAGPVAISPAAYAGAPTPGRLDDALAAQQEQATQTRRAALLKSANGLVG